MALNHFLALGIVAVLAVSCGQQQPTPTAESTPSPSPEAIATSPEPSPVESPTESSEAASAPAQTAARSGTFASGEHPTSGTASLVEQDGQLVLELDEAFQTSSMGPDLVVVLHRAEDVLGTTEPPAYPIQEGDYVVLAPLESFSGAQSYPVPENVNVDEYQSAAIWCRRFNATFGAATLQ